MKYLLILGALSAFLLSSCEKIVAEDLTGKTPVLILPASGSLLTDNTVNFAWNEMEGATSHHLIVVTPSFANPQAFVVDSFITGLSYAQVLDSGSYELMLIGVNNAYRSDTLGPIPFEVNTAGGVNQVTLNTPSDNAFENAMFDGQFNWQPITGATSYEFAIREGTDFTTGTPVETATNIGTSSYSLNASLPEGQYVWGVKAYFATGETPFAFHQLAIDTASPNQASLATPMDGGTESVGTVTFTWTNNNDPGNINSQITSRFELAPSTAFASPIEAQDLSAETYDFDFQNTGTYYWRIINTDAAGNGPVISETFTVIVN